MRADEGARLAASVPGDAAAGESAVQPTVTSCALRPGGGWDLNAFGNKEWRPAPGAGACSWPVPLVGCPASLREEQPHAVAAALAPVAGLTVTLLGDSTTRELARDVAACFHARRLTARGEPLDAFLRVPGARPVRLRYAPATFVRSLLDANVTTLACGLRALEGVDGLPPALAAAHSVTVRAALSSPQAFAEHVGDALVLGAGAWNLQRDHAGNSQPNAPAADGGPGAAKHATVEGLVASTLGEVRAVAEFLAGVQPPAWREELTRRRLLWREVTALEWVPSENHAGRRPEVVAAVNAEASRIMAATAGVRTLPLFQYSAWADPARWRSTSLLGPTRFTRDGVHLARDTQPLVFRELLSVLAQAPPAPLEHGRAEDGVGDDTAGGAGEGAPRACSLPRRPA